MCETYLWRCPSCSTPQKVAIKCHSMGHTNCSQPDKAIGRALYEGCPIRCYRCGASYQLTKMPRQAPVYADNISHQPGRQVHFAVEDRAYQKLETPPSSIERTNNARPDKKYRSPADIANPRIKTYGGEGIKSHQQGGEDIPPSFPDLRTYQGERDKARQAIFDTASKELESIRMRKEGPDDQQGCSQAWEDAWHQLRRNLEIRE